MAETVARISRSERIAQLDVLRGVAVLFILLLNVPYMADYAMSDFNDPRRVSWTGLDQAAWWFNRLIDGTQRGLLELLFGAGIIIMARVGTAREDDPEIAILQRRRSLWLMAFGIAHGVLLLWEGDILFSYGVAALLVFPLRKAAPRVLLTIGIVVGVLMALPSTIEYRNDVQLSERAAAGDVAARQEWQARVDSYARPDTEMMERERGMRLTSLVPYATGAWFSWVYVQFTGIGIFWENIAEGFGTMALGMALFKLGILQGLASRRTYWLMVAAGYGVGVALRVYAGLEELRFDAVPTPGGIVRTLARLPMTLGHVGLVSLLLASRAGSAALAAFVAPGRMPLTIYMGTSIIALLIFGGPFLGTWGQFSYGGMTAIAFAIIAAEVGFANLWLRGFVSGPIDWLWKSLVYKQRQPFRRAVAAAPAMP